MQINQLLVQYFLVLPEVEFDKRHDYSFWNQSVGFQENYKVKGIWRGKLLKFNLKFSLDYHMIVLEYNSSLFCSIFEQEEYVKCNMFNMFSFIFMKKVFPNRKLLRSYFSRSCLIFL